MNIKKLSMTKILSKLNFKNEVNDDDEYSPIDSFTCEDEDDFNDFISVDKAYDFRNAKEKGELQDLTIDPNFNYLGELAHKQRLEAA